LHARGSRRGFPVKLKGCCENIRLTIARLELVADFTLPFWWAVAAAFPILAVWWKQH
jgi:hypothetical protein